MPRHTALADAAGVSFQTTNPGGESQNAYAFVTES